MDEEADEKENRNRTEPIQMYICIWNSACMLFYILSFLLGFLFLFFLISHTVLINIFVICWCVNFFYKWNTVSVCVCVYLYLVAQNAASTSAFSFRECTSYTICSKDFWLWNGEAFTSSPLSVSLFFSRNLRWFSFVRSNKLNK